MITVSVAVDNVKRSFDKLFSYKVPDELCDVAFPGCRVKIPFGSGNSIRDGMIFERNNEDEVSEKCKSVISVLDDVPVLTNEMLDLAIWMKDRYQCTLFKIIKTFLPSKLLNNTKERIIKTFRLKDGIDECKLKLSTKQKAVCEVLAQKGEMSAKEVNYFTGTTVSVLNSLVKNGIVECMESSQGSFLNIATRVDCETKSIVLTEDQEFVYKGLLREINENKGRVSLLYGITGSGKTSVFMKLIKHVVNLGKSVIVMVPEISLTPQMISVFVDKFGRGIAVFHSGLSDRERMIQWKSVKDKSAKIVIGTRSAVFAPVENLGLIIMDEEQEYTYKSESSPRFHARDVAKFRAVENKCLLLLSSATPSVETFFYAQSGKYSLHKLTKRYGEAKLPEVSIVDMNKELMSGNTSQISNALLEQLRDNLKKNEQSIVLLNRRGYNTFASCRKCSQVLLCPNCSISLIYHKANDRLMCHYCGYSVPFSSECPSCHENQVHFSGMGTQRAEDDLLQKLPGARVLRMDTDTTMARFAHEQAFAKFRQKEYDIMIGTQMIAKGLDFPDVTLVGVLSADQSLYNDDFRSYERTFSLLTQVVGRSGRSGGRSRAIIQTYTPENPIIKLAARQDYEAFYRSEINLRKVMLYPPFSDMCVVSFTSTDEVKSLSAAKFFLELIKNGIAQEKKLPMRILGPSRASIYKVNNQYRYRIIIKCRNNIAFRNKLNEFVDKFELNRTYSKVISSVDMNPDTVI